VAGTVMVAVSCLQNPFSAEVSQLKEATPSIRSAVSVSLVKTAELTAVPRVFLTALGLMIKFLVAPIDSTISGATTCCANTAELARIKDIKIPFILISSS
jgi:hypothetical protein